MRPGPFFAVMGASLAIASSVAGNPLLLGGFIASLIVYSKLRKG
jgi:hypothetical protein